MINSTIKLASRTSSLALFQTEAVRRALSAIGIESELVPVQTKGDKDQHTALQNLGQVGIFTKAIDDAVLDGRADVGVHSLKDYPTGIPKGLALLAVLPRDGFYDAFIPGNNLNEPLLSGSPRRKAQWLRKNPKDYFADLRGNMDTRLAKIRRSAGGIVSAPGLERLGMLPEDAEILDWMVPAPAAGVMAIIGRDDQRLKDLFAQINHEQTFRQSCVERDFMAAVEGGCASPLGALCIGEGDTWLFQGVVLSPDGQREVRIEKEFAAKNWSTAGNEFAKEILENGGAEIMAEIKAAQPLDILCLKEINSEQREQALGMGVKLHDLAVLKLDTKPFEVLESTFFIVASSFGADRLVPKIQSLPENALIIGKKASDRLRSSGYNGTIAIFETSVEVLDYIQKNKLRDIVYYGAMRSSQDWEALGIKHVITYTNSPSEPRLARQHWDGIAAFSPLGVDSALAYNKFPKSTPIIAIGPATLEACRRHGFPAAKIATDPSFDSLLKALKDLKNA